MKRNELKFKKNDVVVLKKLPNLLDDLKRCGIYYQGSLLSAKGKIISVDKEDNLPYYVCFNNEAKNYYYLPEYLLELDTMEESEKVEKKEKPTKVLTEDTDSETIKIKYHKPISPLENINGANSDWIDLRCAESNGVDLKAGEFKLISLGVSMKLPDGYEAHIVPRSSTFKTWGLLQTNPHAVIDNSYCSDTDVWKYPVYATRDTHIDFNDRICQFRIVKKQPTILFEKVYHLDGKSRSGFGSSGIK